MPVIKHCRFNVLFLWVVFDIPSPLVLNPLNIQYYQQSLLSSISFMSAWQSEHMSHKEDSLLQQNSTFQTRTAPKCWFLRPRHEVASLIKSIFSHYEEINVVWFVNAGCTGLSAAVKGKNAIKWQSRPLEETQKHIMAGWKKFHWLHGLSFLLSLPLPPEKKINGWIKYRSVILILLFAWWMAAHRGALLCQVELSGSWVIGF